MSPTILNIVEISLAKSNGRCMKDAERSFTEKRSAEKDRCGRYSNGVSVRARKAFVYPPSFVYVPRVSI